MTQTSQDMRLERFSYPFSLLLNSLLKDQSFSELIISFVQFISMGKHEELSKSLEEAS